jgi:bifunctional non-homologous end joining protein LigD
MSARSHGVRLKLGEPLEIPSGRRELAVRAGRHAVRLTNLTRPYFPEAGITKGDLLRYYAAVAPVLLPHLRGRPMVMKRYPNGIRGTYFFMKRTPAGAPEWLERCTVEHASGNVIDFPVVNELGSLLWLVNLGCIDLNPWVSRCDDVDRPDVLHFDLDPVQPAGFAEVRRAALLVRDALEKLGARSIPKTSGSTGMHVYVPIRRGPVQKDVWRFAKGVARVLAAEHPGLLTAEYRIAKRPPGTVLVDYNQNAWGQTLASVYSARPRAEATVSTPLAWQEVEAGVEMGSFTVDTVPERVAAVGDLWRPMVLRRGRFDLGAHL